MAGEIQLNSTTMATESSGSITAELDTIRPNTTNGSLTLQGDSSNSGVTGLTIDSSGNATFAQTITGGTIGSGVVFPAGMILNTATGLKTSSDTTTANNNTGTSGFDTGVTVDLNVSSNSNYVLVIANVNWAYDTGNDSRLTIQATKSGQTTVEIAKSLQFGLNAYHAISVALGGKFTPAVSGVWTFTVYGQSTGNMGINAQNGSGSTITDQDALTLVSSITAFEVQV